MACCTTIPPLNSGQKRSSGGIFDLPKSAKRRRPFTSTSITTMSAMPSSVLHNTTTSLAMSPSKFNSPSSSSTSMFSNNFNNNITPSSKIIDASDENKRNSSIFQSTSHFQYDDTTNNNHQQFQFNTELMQRFKHEAKRLIKKRNQQKINIETSQANTSSSSGTDDEITTTTPSPKISKINTSNISNNNNSSLSVSSSILSKNASNNTLKLTNSATTTTSTSSTISQLKVASNDLSTVNNKSAIYKNHNDLPLFSMNQVNQICAGMIREREQVIREQYDKILAEKLSEQYDSFVKFTHEQIQRRFENSQCSYVS